MKTCGSCRLEKPLEFFHRRGKGHQSICKGCRKANDREKYDADPLRHALIRNQRRKELKVWSLELKRDRPCTDCGGVFHPVAMQWDHLGDKEVNVSEMADRGYSKAHILREIAKCELVCANCHAVRTYTRMMGLLSIVG
jgi:hypothetical protein